VYGGYERKEKTYDKKKVDNSPGKCIFLDDGTYITIFKFLDGSSLETDGYDLYFIT
jgi:hypothetical protein